MFQASLKNIYLFIKLVLYSFFFINKLSMAKLFFFLGNDNAVAPTHLYADDPQLNCSEANLTQA